ncbi:hypothetical protein CRUP_004894, partial [Coryphaenoides rupestris]
MVSPSLDSSACWVERLRGSAAAMPTLPGLSSLGRICGSGRADDTLVLDRVKRKNSVRRMSIIEDGEIAEVLYLIPKQSMMEQLPFLNPDDYILCEKMVGMPMEKPPAYQSPRLAPPPPAPERRRVQCFRCGEACKGEVLKACGEYVEGEVVTALGKAYHPACFVCTSCRRPFPTGDRVTFNGKACLCQHCCVKPLPSSPNYNSFSNNCVGCGRDIKNGQALLALEGQWHLGCFKCTTCHRLLTGEYLSRCDLLFKEGEEMFLQDCRSDSRGDNRYRRSTTPCLHYLYPPAEIQATRSSTESISSRPTSTLPTSPGHSICAKVDDQMVDYRDLAALPRVKTILDIERPDLLSYGSSSHTQNNQSSPPDRPQPAQVSPERRRKSGGARSIHRHSYTPTVSPQHFHRPDMTSCLSASMFSPPFSDHFLPVTAEHQDNLYMKPPIYKQHDTPLAAFQTSSLPSYGRHSRDFCQLSYGDTADGPTG